MKMPRVLIPIALGTNRDHDLAQAFTAAGAEPVSAPLSALRAGEVRLEDFQLLAIPGGFSYGDALGAGRLLGLDLAGWFGDQLRAAVDREIPIFGVCNGFQALVRAGLLPGSGHKAVLTENASRRFECRWVTLLPSSHRSVWTAELTEPLRCPVAHGEGQFVADDLDRLIAEDAIAFRYGQATSGGSGSEAGGGDWQVANEEYPANPNGSAGDVAGVCDDSGMVLGLMPHPEDHVLQRQDPLRGRVGGTRPGGGSFGSCLPLFEAGVSAVGGYSNARRGVPL